jgi:uncharacterized repeat protein (TIGR01451 family)
MSGRSPAARQALLLLAGVVLGLFLGPGVLWAQRLQPQPRTGEPPLAPGVTPPVAVPGPGGPPAAEPVDPPTPAVSLRVRVPATATVGQELEYRIFLENTSQAPAHHVTLSNPLPANLRLVRANPEPTGREPKLFWDLGTLQAGVRRMVVLVVIPMAEGDVTSTARVTFEHGESVRTRVSGGTGAATPKPITMPPPPATADLQLRVTGPALALQNDRVTFVLDVSNAGRGDAANVVLTAFPDKEFTYSGSTPKEDSQSPLTWKLGALRAGQSARITCDLLAITDKPTTLQLKAEVRDGTGMTAASAQVMIKERPAPGEAKLNIKMTGPASQAVGKPASYQITVSNPGTAAASNVYVHYVLPAPDKVGTTMTFVDASQGGTLVADRVRWMIPSLAAGAQQTLQLTIQATAAGKVQIWVTAQADGGLKVASEEVSTLFDGSAGLTWEIHNSPDPLAVGKKGIYTIKVINQGTAAATNLSLVVTLPDALKLVDSRGPANKGSALGQSVNFDPPTTLRAGGEAIYTLEVEAVKPGSIKVKAELRASELTAGALTREATSTLVE